MAARREDSRPGEGAMAEHWRAIGGGETLCPTSLGRRKKDFEKVGRDDPPTLDWG
jgi:hypothetical protein